MATVQVKLPTELMNDLTKLGKETDRIVISCLKQAAKPVKTEVQKALDRVSPRPLIVRRRGRLYNYGIRSTGSLRRSIGVSPVKLDRKGDYDVKIGFAGYVKRGDITHSRLSALIEAGSKTRSQPPRPFLRTAKRMSMKAASDTFIAAFDEEVKKL